MPCCCAFGCRNWTEDGKKLFCIPRGKQNLSRRKVWLHRIGRKDFEPSSTVRLCEVSLTLPEERHATLMLDEMQLAPGLVYNPSSGTVLGAATTPLADGTLPSDCWATHGLVIMLGGITTRWKHTVAYRLTGNSSHAKTVKDIFIVIIKACEAISLKKDVVVTDMGGRNQAVWKLFGIIVGKHSKPKTSCPHPCDAFRQLVS
ncbi:hypothetical protein HPB51_022260 [Rhipicephalus microplus]|uniref:Tick transposon n=1 Tax=Rhipicephalus microplus TaxID=6941 RepID=A0A9J6DPS6_RHIMP|nr:hypothetical protein HPB51_022260 [Rhipicephalus microplus]